MEEFFKKVSVEIENSQEDGSLLTVFTPMLDVIKERFRKDFTLNHPEVNSWLNIVLFFTKAESLAQVCGISCFVSYEQIL